MLEMLEGAFASRADIAPVLAGITSAAGALGAVLLVGNDRGVMTVIDASPTISADALANVVLAVSQQSNDHDGGALRWLSTATGETLMVTSIEQGPGRRLFMLAISFRRLGASMREGALRACNRLLPLIGTCLRLWQATERRARHQQALGNALHGMNLGVLMLRRTGEILFSNRTADKLLERGEGLQAYAGMLRTNHLSDGFGLTAALSHATRDPERHARTSAPLLTFQRAGLPPLVAIIVPPAIGAGQEEEAIMYIVDPASELDKGIPALCRLHGLSQVETTLVCHLVRGEVLSAAARKMRIKELTARGYLKHIFLKTGTCRQTELVIRMLNSLIPIDSSLEQEALAVRPDDRAMRMMATPGAAPARQHLVRAG